MDQTEIANNEYRHLLNGCEIQLPVIKIYYGLEEDEDADRFINYNDMYFDEGALEYVEYDGSDRELNRTVFSLNWDRSFSYADPELVPILADMYTRSLSATIKEERLDVRKLMLDTTGLIWLKRLKEDE